MKILYLGPLRSKIVNYLTGFGAAVINIEDKITKDSELVKCADFILSFGYKHIIKPDVLALFPGRAINLHISYLPWNRGADPNLWSFLEDSPKGVTIHYIDKGLDTGDILAQREVKSRADDTLRTSYDRLIVEIEDLLIECWPRIVSGEIRPKPQSGNGSYHRSEDKLRFMDLLYRGWDTPIKDITRKMSDVDRQE